MLVKAMMAHNQRQTRNDHPVYRTGPLTAEAGRRRGRLRAGDVAPAALITLDGHTARLFDLFRGPTAPSKPSTPPPDLASGNGLGLMRGDDPDLVSGDGPGSAPGPGDGPGSAPGNGPDLISAMARARRPATART